VWYSEKNPNFEINALRAPIFGEDIFKDIKLFQANGET
jgi:hypothetical protein